MVDINEWTRVGSPVADKKAVPMVVGSHQRRLNDMLIKILSSLLCISGGGGGSFTRNKEYQNVHQEHLLQSSRRMVLPWEGISNQSPLQMMMMLSLSAATTISYLP